MIGVGPTRLVRAGDGRLVGHDDVHANIVKLGGDQIAELLMKSDADAGAVDAGEEAIIETAAPSEAIAGPVKGKTRYQPGRGTELRGRGRYRIVSRFRRSVRAYRHNRGAIDHFVLIECGLPTR